MASRSWIAELCREEQLPAGYGEAVTRCVAPLAGRIGRLRQATGRPVCVGVSGAQGSGKTTLCRFLEIWLKREAGLSTATLSLDDLYLARSERQQLARERHPLFATRGVPGTHDVKLGEQLLEQLMCAHGPVGLPVFDKAQDDRLAATRDVAAPVDVVLLEGWCVGAKPQSPRELGRPINVLESGEDPDGSWRQFVNDRLATDYADLFNRLDVLVYLRLPSFEKVFEWRSLQEKKLAGGFDAESMRRFISHFERLSRHMIETVPACANVVIDVDHEHEMASPEFRDWPSASD